MMTLIGLAALLSAILSVARGDWVAFLLSWNCVYLACRCIKYEKTLTDIREMAVTALARMEAHK